MARPREFDEVEVLERARTAFWSGGVAATPISAISDATGLSIGSLYKAFGSKDELCALTLDDYLSRSRSHIAAIIEQASTPWVGVRVWLDTTIDAAVDPSPTCGCYAVELAAERAMTDERIRTLLVDHDERLRALVTDAVTRGIETGEVVGDAEGIARLLLTTVNGLQVDARKGITRTAARLTIDTMLTAFETAPAD